MLTDDFLFMEGLWADEVLWAEGLVVGSDCMGDEEKKE